MALAMAMPSCENNDNSDELMSGLNGLEKRVEALETLQDQITAIQELLEAAQRNHITSVEEVKDEAGNVIGYKINFQDSDPITIYNGGSASGPQITVEEEAGELYWKVNGEWLLDGNGNKVPAQGKTPTFRVNSTTGKWEYSFNDADWNVVEGAPTGGGIAVNTDNEDYVRFTLDNGTTIDIPWYKPLDIEFSMNGEIKNNFQIDGSATSYTIDYNITGLKPTDNPIIKAFADNKDYNVVVEEGAEAGKGSIKVYNSSAIAQGQVTVLVSDGDQRTIMRTITFVSSDAGTIINVTTKNYIVSAIGDDNLQIDFESDVKMADLEIVIPDDAKSWITCGTGIESRTLTPYKCVLKVSANDTDKSRSATITLRDKTFATVVIPVDIIINQSSLTVSVENVTAGGLQDALADKNPETITSLKISGSLNETDLAYILSLSKTSSNGKLLSLDMAKVTLSDDKLPTKCLNYTNLTKVILPEMLKSIGQEALRACKITSIEIPSSVTWIDALAFLQCSELTSVIIKGAPTLNKESFGRCPKLMEVRAESPEVKTLTSAAVYVFSKNSSAPTSAADLQKVDNLVIPVGTQQAYQDAGWTNFFTTVTEATE